MTPTDTTERIAALLHEAAETHHVVYRIVDGEDPDGRRGTRTGSCGSPSCRSCSARRPSAATWSMPLSSTATPPARSAGRTRTRRRCSSASAPAEAARPGRFRGWGVLRR